MKPYRYVFLIAILTLFLSACSSGTVTEKAEAEKKPITEQKAPETDTSSTETNTPGFNVALTPADTEYMDNITKALGGMEQIMDDFSSLLQQSSNNPAIMADSTWVKNMAITLVLMGQYADTVTALTPGPNMTEVHEETKLAMNEYSYVAENYASAIDNLDLDLMSLCTQAMQRGGEHIQNATAMLNDMKE